MNIGSFFLPVLQVDPVQKGVHLQEFGLKQVPPWLQPLMQIAGESKELVERHGFVPMISYFSIISPTFMFVPSRSLSHRLL